MSQDSLQEEAEAGNVEAMYQLALAWELGRDGVTDLPLARQWLEKAAQKGYEPAAKKLRSLETGIAVTMQAIAEGTLTSPPTKATVVMVDDDDEIHATVKLILKGTPIKLIGFKTGSQGLEYFRSGNPPPDLCLLDYDMPGLNGLQLASSIRQIHGDEVLLAMVSGQRETSLIVGAKKLGFCAWMVKPFDPRKLRESIFEMVGLTKESA